MDLSDLLPSLPPTLNNDYDVCDQQIAPDLFSQKGVSPKLAFSSEDFMFNAEAEASFSLKLFNDANDHGKEKIFEHWPGVKDLYPDHALLGYSLKGKIKASASGAALEKFEFGLDADQIFDVQAFRVHGCGEKIEEAYKADVSKFRHIFSKDDVRDLQVNEALAYEAAGQLELSASVKVSDVFSGTASVVAGFLDLNGKIQVKVDASASITLNVKIEDDFSVVIVKLGEDNYKVVINKIIKRSNRLGLKAGIEVGAVQNDQLEELVDQFFEGIDEKVFEPINEKIKNSSLSDLLDNEWVEQAAYLLGLDLPSPGDFEEAYLEKRGKVREKLLEIIETKVALGVAYEYSIVKTNETIFEASFTQEKIVEFHRDIVGLKVNRLIDAYLGSPSAERPFTLEKYLKRDLEEVSRSIGISLSFGNFKLSSAVLKEFTQEQVRIVDDTGEKFRVNQYNNKVTKTYRHGKNKDEYVLAFDSSMPHFVSSESQLTLDKFDFDLSLSFEMTENRTSDKELRDIVDWALTWDIIPQSRVKPTIEAIRANVLGVDSRGIKYHCFLKIPAGEFDILIPYFKNVKNTIVPSALAASVLQVDYNNIADFRTRQDIDLRREYYTAFWGNYINQNDTLPTDGFLRNVADALSNELYDKGLKDLSKYESGEGNYDRLFDRHQKGSYNSSKVVEILKGNDIRREIEGLIRDMDKINTAIMANEHYDKRKVRKALKRIGDTSFLKDFNLRFFGRLLLDMNTYMGEEVNIERGLNLTYQQDGEEKVYVIA